MASAHAVRNLIGTAAVLALFFMSFVAAPDMYLQQTELSCESKWLGVFPDMNACSKVSKPGCICFRTENHWFKAYQWGLVPLMVGVVGYIALRGPLRTRLILLNTAIVCGYLVNFGRELLKEPNALMVLPLLPFLIGAFCIAISAVFLLTRYLHARLYQDTT